MNTWLIVGISNSNTHAENAATVIKNFAKQLLPCPVVGPFEYQVTINPAGTNTLNIG